MDFALRSEFYPRTVWPKEDRNPASHQCPSYWGSHVLSVEGREACLPSDVVNVKLKCRELTRYTTRTRCSVAALGLMSNSRTVGHFYCLTFIFSVMVKWSSWTKGFLPTPEEGLLVDFIPDNVTTKKERKTVEKVSDLGFFQ